MTNSASEQGALISRMEDTPKRFLFSGIDDSTLVRAFLQNKREQVEAEQLELKENEGKIVVEVKLLI